MRVDWGRFRAALGRTRKPRSCTAAGWTLLADSGVSLAGVVAALFAGKPGVTLQNEI
jgi:hypothetical protein